MLFHVVKTSTLLTCISKDITLVKVQRKSPSSIFTYYDKCFWVYSKCTELVVGSKSRCIATQFPYNLYRTFFYSGCTSIKLIYCFTLVNVRRCIRHASLSCNSNRKLMCKHAAVYIQWLDCANNETERSKAIMLHNHGMCMQI